MGPRIDDDRGPATGTSRDVTEARGDDLRASGPAAAPASPRPTDPLATELDRLRSLLDPAVVSVEAYPTEGDWLAARRTGIGASEAAAVLGLVRSRSRVAVWLDKVGVSEPAVELERMKWGRRLQRPIADGYIEETGRDLIDPGPWTLLRSVRYPFLLATPDYLIRAPAVRPDPGLLEIKSTSAFARAEWREEPPVPYLIQVQAQLLVSGLDWAALAALIGGAELVYTDVPPHPGARDWIVEDLAAFWDLVQREEPPRPLDGSEATTAALRRLYPTATPATTIRLPDEASAWDEIIVAGESHIKRLTAAVEAARNELRVALGAAESGELDGVVWTNKVETRKGYTRFVEPWSGRVLRRRAPRGDDGGKG
jgi:putative phage-type endonuclease